jgi:predicted O-methyltransferase YrrM
MSLLALAAQIRAARDGEDTWCNLAKAETLAALVVATRPQLICELGVWRGASLLPQLLALKHNGVGHALAVDAWSTEASVAGQEAVHVAWWGQQVGPGGHDRAFKTFLARLEKHGVAKLCTVLRQSTDQAPVPITIDILHHDANHGPQAVLDVERWAPAVRVGGYLVIDDLDWPGPAAPAATPRHVARARERALELGFAELYALGTGCVMQRVRAISRPAPDEETW